MFVGESRSRVFLWPMYGQLNVPTAARLGGYLLRHHEPARGVLLPVRIPDDRSLSGRRLWPRNVLLRLSWPELLFAGCAGGQRVSIGVHAAKPRTPVWLAFRANRSGRGPEADGADFGLAGIGFTGHAALPWDVQGRRGGVG